MKEQAPTYSQHSETLLALVTFLATCEIHDNDQERRDNASAQELSVWLSLELPEVETVLDGFHGLFRKSQTLHPTGTTVKELDYRYVLVLRYARRKYFGTGKPEWGSPLSNEELIQLLSFVGDKVRDEQESKRHAKANMITLIAIAITFVTSLLSLFVGLSK